VVADTATSDSLFPQGKPWQAKYAAFALDNELRVQVRKVCLFFYFASRNSLKHAVELG